MSMRQLLSLSQWDRLFLRLARFIRDMLGAPDVHRYTMRQASFSASSAGLTIAVNDPDRVTLIFSVRITSNIIVSPARGSGVRQGVALNLANTPFVLTRDIHRDLVSLEWSTSNVTAVPELDEITVLELVRVT